MSSDANTLPRDVLFQTRDAILNMTLIETFGDGIYSAIFWFTLYTIVFRERAKGVPIGMSKLMTIIPLYVLAMLHLSIRWALCTHAFVVDGDTALDTLESFLAQPEWCVALSVVSFVLMTWIADFVMIWRLWEVWNHSWKVALIPLLLMLVGVAFAIMSAIFQIDPSSGLLTDEADKFEDFGVVYFSLSLTSTVICTSLIVYRIISVTRKTGFGLRSGYRRVLEIVVESAALYSVALIVYLPLLADGRDFADGYPQAILICITGIAPTIIVCRVSLGISWDNSEKHQRKNSHHSSALYFSPASNPTLTA